MVIRQLQVERMTAKERWPETDVLPMSHADQPESISQIVTQGAVCVFPAYQINVLTSDRQDAGTQHNAWIILEGDERTSQEFLMENSSRHKILRRYDSVSTRHLIMTVK